jgi:hypothetical protein
MFRVSVNRVKVKPVTIAAKGFSLICLMLSLMACVPLGRIPMGPVSRMIPPQPDHCNAQAFAGLQGEHFARLADKTLAGPLRVIWPQQLVTGEIDTTRLNAQVSATGRINRLFCG